MAVITDIRSAKNRNRVNIFIDGSLALTIARKVLADTGLKTGQQLNEPQIKILKESDLNYRCLDSALYFLSYRPRSVTEVRQRLLKRGFSKETIVPILNSLKKQDLINDREFARYWCDNRITFNPRSKFILKQELKQKGIKKELVDDAVNSIDEEEAAYKAGKKRANTIQKLEFNEFRKKLFSFLQWRGFSFETMNNVCTRLWNEKNITE